MRNNPQTDFFKCRKSTSITNLMRKNLIILLLISQLVSLNVFAGDYQQVAVGKVVDSYSRELMKEFQADLLRPDSSLIKSYFPRENYSYNQPMNLRIDSLPASDCIIRVTAEGYYPRCINVSQPGKKERGIELKPIMMTRTATEIYRQCSPHHTNGKE